MCSISFSLFIITMGIHFVQLQGARKSKCLLVFLCLNLNLLSGKVLYRELGFHFMTMWPRSCREINISGPSKNAVKRPATFEGWLIWKAPRWVISAAHNGDIGACKYMHPKVSVVAFWTSCFFIYHDVRESHCSSNWVKEMKNVFKWHH